MAEEALIPKKAPRTAMYPSEGFGVFLRIAFVIFLVAALFSGGLYLYKNYAANSLVRQRALLEKLKIEFDPSTIFELEKISKSIVAARGLLRGHEQTSKIFDMLEAGTLPSVAFSSFSFSAERGAIGLAGEALSYGDVSLQANVFESLPSVLSTTFSNLSLKESGSVGFNMNILFKK